MSSSGMGRNIHSFMLSIQHFLCRTRRRPPFKVKEGLREAVVASWPEPCKVSSLDSRQKMFLRTHKEVALAPHLVFDLWPQVGDAEKFPQALGFESLKQFFFSESASRVHVLQPQKRMEVSLVKPEVGLVHTTFQGKSSFGKIVNASEFILSPPKFFCIRQYESF